jgi:hypothetical protein
MRLAEKLANLALGQLVLGQAERHSEPDQSLLNAIVQMPLYPAAAPPAGWRGPSAPSPARSR